MIKKLQVLKSDVLVPIQISAGFYKNIQECCAAILDSMPDAKLALINIEKASKEPSFKLSMQEYTLTVLMNLTFEIENVAKSDPDKYIEEKEFKIDDELKN